MPPPEPCEVLIGIPALQRSSISRLIVLLDTSNFSASSGAVVFSSCSKMDKIPMSLSDFISSRSIFIVQKQTRQLYVMFIVTDRFFSGKPFTSKPASRSHRNWQAVHIDAGHSFTSTRMNGLVVHLVHIENCTLSPGENAPSPGERVKKKKP